MAPIMIPTSSDGFDDGGSVGWGEGSDGFGSTKGSGGPKWVWIGVKASVVGFFFFFFFWGGFLTFGLCSVFVWREDEIK